MTNKLLELSSLFKSIYAAGRSSARIFKLHFGAEKRHFVPWSLFRFYLRALPAGAFLNDFSTEHIEVKLPLVQEDSQLHQAVVAIVNFFLQQIFPSETVDIRIESVEQELYSALPAQKLTLSFFLSHQQSEQAYRKCLHSPSVTESLQISVQVLNSEGLLWGQFNVTIAMRLTVAQIALLREVKGYG